MRKKETIVSAWIRLILGTLESGPRGELMKWVNVLSRVKVRVLSERQEGGKTLVQQQSHVRQ